MRKTNVYVVEAWSRHNQRREKVGVRTYNAVLARAKVEHEIGKVLSVQRVSYMPSDVNVEFSYYGTKEDWNRGLYQ